MATSVFDLLMAAQITPYEEDLPTEEVEVLRLSRMVGAPIIFKVRALTLKECDSMRRLSDSDLDIACCAAGIVEPDLREERWSQLLQLSPMSPPEKILPALLNPGELSTLCTRIQRLSGYKEQVLDDVKKN